MRKRERERERESVLLLFFHDGKTGSFPFWLPLFYSFTIYPFFFCSLMYIRIRRASSSLRLLRRGSGGLFLLLVRREREREHAREREKKTCSLCFFCFCPFFSSPLFFARVNFDRRKRKIIKDVFESTLRERERERERGSGGERRGKARGPLSLDLDTAGGRGWEAKFFFLSSRNSLLPSYWKSAAPV